MSEALEKYYLDAYTFVKEAGYEDEIMWVDGRHFKDITPDYFFREYVFVVCNSGMRNQVAQKIFDNFMEDLDFNKIPHGGKRKGIEGLYKNYKGIFITLSYKEDKIEFLETLPWIGPITKYHLARNLGIDCCKPDRHLVRLAEQFKFKDPNEMCDHLAKKFGERIGTIDVVLWRHENLTR